jgi:hypothetical protein
MSAVTAILGETQPAVIDDMVYLALLSEDPKETDAILERAEAIYYRLFGDAGRPFSTHVRGLAGSVCAPRVLFNS